MSRLKAFEPEFVGEEPCKEMEGEIDSTDT